MLEVPSYSQLLLAIYREAREAPAEQFQDAVLELLKRLVRFDSSMWGSGSLAPAGMTVNSIHLHNQPQEMVTEWQHVNHEDTIAFTAAQRPGWVMNANMPTLYRDRDKSAIRDYAQRFEKGNGLVTRCDRPDSRLIEWVSLYRADPDQQFSEDERQRIELLVPHVVEALTINRQFHLQRTFTTGSAIDSGVAISDGYGVIYSSGPGFDDAMRAEWSGWAGGCLPPALCESFRRPGAPAYQGRRIGMKARVVGDLLFLQARRLTAVDRLTPREREVARRYGAGQSYKEVARALSLSPATVRNYLQTVYHKLGIDDKAQLAAAMASESEPNR